VGVARPSPACVAQLYEDFENAKGPHSAAVKAVGGPRRRAAAAAVGADGGFADVCGLARGEESGSVLGSRSAESSSTSTADATGERTDFAAGYTGGVSGR